MVHPVTEETTDPQNGTIPGLASPGDSTLDQPPDIPTCGIVMPISDIDGCSSDHWAEVLQILSEAINEAGYHPNLVSDAAESSLIHKRIVENLYLNPIVVCDVSGLNPNVMFELGMRLTFDRPTIVIKDDQTKYTFDTGGIEHVGYRRDLRFAHTIGFKSRLKEKIIATCEAAKNPKHTTYLRNFGSFKIPKLDTEEVSVEKYLFDYMKELGNEIRSIHKDVNRLYADRNRVEPNLRGMEFNKDSINVTNRKLWAMVRIEAEMFVRNNNLRMEDIVQMADANDAFIDYLRTRPHSPFAGAPSGELRVLVHNALI
jgi:hypothetical protein